MKPKEHRKEQKGKGGKRKVEDAKRRRQRFDFTFSGVDSCR